MPRRSLRVGGRLDCGLEFLLGGHGTNSTFDILILMAVDSLELTLTGAIRAEPAWHLTNW